MEVIDISSRKIGPKNACFIIAEVAQAHDGSLGIAHSYIDAFADAGADAIKFQTHIADAESTINEKFRIPFSYEDQTRYDYWKRIEFTEEQWRGLSDHAQARGMIFLSSPFSVQAAKLLEELQIAAWKIGSGELGNIELLEYIAQTKKPILLSSGMSSWEELDNTVCFLNNYQIPHAIFQCTSSYPVKLSHVGLNVIKELKEKFKVPTGLSDHSGTLFPSLAAMSQGADLIEVHVVFHKEMFGPDSIASISIDDLHFLIKARNAFWEMKKKVDKDKMASKMEKMKKTFGRSLAPKYDLPKNKILSEKDLTLKKPGTGILYENLKKVIGKQVVRAIPKKKLIQWEDLKNDKK